MVLLFWLDSSSTRISGALEQTILEYCGCVPRTVKFSRITNSSGLVVQRNQTLRLTESLRMRLDDLNKRL